MLNPATVGLLLALTHTAAGGKTLWLTEPLYPGQDYVVVRAEEALDRLMPPQGRTDDVVGKKGLTAFLKDKDADLGCLTDASTCLETAYWASSVYSVSS